MTFDLAIRLTEILLGIALLQQSLEHLHVRHDKILFVPRVVLSVLLVIGFQPAWVCAGLMIAGLLILRRFNGPYNGGSDRMGLLILCSLYVVLWVNNARWQEYVFGYLALQLTLSYFMSGWVKLVNPEWRNGRALQDVFRFSVYPVSEALRKLADRPRLLWAASWAVILFELCFPLTLLAQETLVVGLIIGAGFHLANAWLFGLNRFFWVWLTSYPSILWLQSRIAE